MPELPLSTCAHQRSQFPWGHLLRTEPMWFALGQARDKRTLGAPTPPIWVWWPDAPLCGVGARFGLNDVGVAERVGRPQRGLPRAFPVGRSLGHGGRLASR